MARRISSKGLKLQEYIKSQVELGVSIEEINKAIKSRPIAELEAEAKANAAAKAQAEAQKVEKNQEVNVGNKEIVGEQEIINVVNNTGSNVTKTNETEVNNVENTATGALRKLEILESPRMTWFEEIEAQQEPLEHMSDHNAQSDSWIW